MISKRLIISPIDLVSVNENVHEHILKLVTKEMVQVLYKNSWNVGSL